MPINKLLTEADMKTILHLKSTRDKYTWLDAVLANEEKYMEMAGLLGGGGGTSAGGKAIPAVLQGHNVLSNALVIDSNTFTIPFDESGADRDFIQKVPLEFSTDGGEPWEAQPPGGWTYQKTDTSIIFTNPNPQPPEIIIRFNTDGTEYQLGGGYASVQDAYDTALQLWVCIECNDRHVYHSQKKLPLEAHQRLVYLLLEHIPETYYAAIGTVPTTGSPERGSLEFQVYRHEEDMESTYNVQLYKYDHETGNPLENSTFKLYERFDDQDEIDKERDGPVHIYEGGEPYKSYHTDNPVTWDGYRFVTGLSTDKNGYVSKTMNHGYHYDKTFCDGHPAPVFVAVPEEEEDEETGEVSNEGEIEAAQAENKRLAQEWISCYAACEAHASGEFEGVHFHWLMPEVDQGEIESILSSGGAEGDTPSAGKTTSATGEESYQESGCQEDCRQTCEKFISLRYSYAFVESQAREGYTLHGTHADDLPIEVITTDSSENGANAAFAGEYGKDIAINDNMAYSLADETLTARKEIADYRLSDEEFGNTEDIRLAKERENYRQDIVRLFVPNPEGTMDGEEADDDIELIDDVTGNPATPSDARIPSATPSNGFPLNGDSAPNGDTAPDTAVTLNVATASDMATASNAVLRSQIIFSRSNQPISASSDEADEDDGDEGTGGGGDRFQSAYNMALNGSSLGEDLEPGPTGNYSHCNHQDGEGDAWRVYDHRTEGELHINKRDMDLAAGTAGDYDSYGDSQGDGTLEGAVYGLFAATDIIHPDGRTGVVYKANNLVAVAATDRNGDASFMVNTEPPGYRYHYESGQIVRTEDGWSDEAPGNLYTGDISYDDYSEDGAYERTYADNGENNGSCWIGRPLILGSYYIKELARSEGYELSIGNRDSLLTNRGQDCDVALPVGTGYANIVRGLYAEGQISANPTGDFGNPGINELFFTAESRGTGANGFDLVFGKLPAGARLYRLDTGTETKEVETGTGIYEKVYLTNEDGSPRYVVAANNYQYPRYNPDGSLLTVETSVNYRANHIPAMAQKPLDPEKTQAAIQAAEPELAQESVLAKLAADFSVAETDFFKAKVERALRANGKRTPRTQAGGKTVYSSISAGVYDTGVLKGEPDENGISGVEPGEAAAKTVYGAPVITLEIPAADGQGIPLKTGDVILSVLDYYNRNAFYSYGGIHGITADDGTYYITVYGACQGNPADFIVKGGSVAGEGMIYHRVSYLPDANLSDERGQCPRYLYAIYSNVPDDEVFGTYEDYSGETFGGTYFASATLITDAVADADGNLVSKTVKQNVYYKTGEVPRDENGKQIQAFEYREQTVKTTQEVEAHAWTELKAAGPAGDFAVHVESSYIDHYGAAHEDGVLQTYSFRILLPQKEITLTEEDIGQMQPQSGWSSGEKMGSAAYYLNVKQAKANAYLNYADLGIVGDSSFVKRAKLTYPGQEYVWQDGENRPGTNTRMVPAAVQERAIKQKIKITKTIDKTSYGDANTYAAVHEDWFTRLFATKGDEAQKLGNFRFKTYLKSNLQRLYRDEEGQVIWMDRNGNVVDIVAYKAAFPEKVQKIYTKVPHTPEIRKNSEETVVANRELYSFSNGFIQEEQNPGYTSVLEWTNYQKFFDGIRTANTDRWDNPLGRRREFTTWEAWDAVRNMWEGASDPVVRDTSYKPFARILAGQFGASDASRSSYPAVHDGAETKNEGNTSAKAKANAMSSDAVRQFAITWYLDDEVKKLVEENAGGEEQNAGGSMAYPDELYDRALFEAIKKADNYLTPFFTYDLDEIYAIEWDGEENGGKDADPATLCADLLQEGAERNQDGSNAGYYYGISAYLPYGTYVVAEQQPYNHQEGQYDFPNRHYKTDAPKEISLPAVYEPGGESQLPEQLAGRYEYRSALTPEELAAEYHIRFNEEWAANHTDDIRGYVIRAHNASGDFEVYKYGLDVDRLTGTVDGLPYDGWKVTQDTYDPIKDYYNDPLVAPAKEGGNPDSHYFADDRNHSPSSPQFPAYLADEIEKHYHYASISEHAKTTEQGSAMTGEQTACEGQYAPMLVPWTVMEPVDAADYDGSEFCGYADRKFQNEFYSVKLRLEKLDSETGESILHDQALFAIYAADRDDSETGEGLVKFYEKPTTISGSREFLEAMGAVNLYTRARGIPDPELLQGALWYGTVPAGTPVCREAEQILLQDEEGNKTGEFRAFSTMRDGMMMAETGTAMTVADQNTGYLELPQPLGAGVYVLAEIKPPSGYARCSPVAVEVYSDQVTYYLDGERDSRVAAAVYEETAGSQARVYVGNTPVRLEVSKKKTDAKTVTYLISGRVEGSITELNGRYGLDSLELAYNSSGTYLGYGWKKGTIESLAARKEAGEAVEILYENGVFSGRAEITRPLLMAEDTNRYVAGALLTLYDAISVGKNGDSQDYAFDGVVVERDRNSNVTRMYVRQGYAGTKTVFVRQENQGGAEAGHGAPQGGVWTCQTIQRPDTDILYYDLRNLKLLSRDSAGHLWSYDKDGAPVRIVAGVTESIYALQNKEPFLEIVSSDFSGLRYDPMAKAFTKMAPDTVIYHLNADGQRDAMVDGYTGMAYVPGTADAQHGQQPRQLRQSRQSQVIVWPVTVIKDHDGSVLAKNKIKTSRVASIHADTDQEYTIGTYHSSEGGSFEKRMNPVLDRHGQVEYYQRSDETYQKSSPVYDRDGDFIYDRYRDSLEQYNDDAYRIKSRDSVFDKGLLWDRDDNREEKLFMRQGDNYLMENTWVSGSSTPNDPFDSDVFGSPSVGQADMLKRVIPGTYILEELEPPEGCARAFPTGVTVEESPEIQRAEMTDETIKVEISKVDAPEGAPEKKGAYSYLPVSGATLVLCRARKVCTPDTAAYPDGWYLVKTETQPASWTVYDEKNVPSRFTAEWTSTEQPLYLEGVPAGDYILEERDAPSGYVRATAWLEVKETGEVQTFQIGNDHTKLEILKYQTADGKKQPLPNIHAAQLTLYPAVADEHGRPVMEHGRPLYEEKSPVEAWTTDDCRQYTTLTDLAPYEKWGIWAHIKSLFGAGPARYSGFIHDYEAMYREYGTGFEKLHWYYTDVPYEGSGELPNLREGVAHLTESHEADRSGCVTQLWKLADGRTIRITVSPSPDPLTGEPFTFEYQFHYRKLAGNMVSYDTAEGCHRIDYIPWDGAQEGGEDGAAYVLVETITPEGYQTAGPKLIWIHETTAVQLYELENRPEPTEPETPEETVPETPEEPSKETPPETQPETPAPPTSPETPEETEPTPPQTEPETPQTSRPHRPGNPDDGPEPTTVPQTSPEIPEETRIGRITARYDGGPRGGDGLQGWYRRQLSKTGDGFPLWLWLSLFAVSGVGILVVIRRRKYGEKSEDHPIGAVDNHGADSDEHCKMPGSESGDDSGDGVDDSCGASHSASRGDHNPL